MELKNILITAGVVGAGFWAWNKAKAKKPPKKKTETPMPANVRVATDLAGALALEDSLSSRRLSIVYDEPYKAMTLAATKGVAGNYPNVGFDVIPRNLSLALEPEDAVKIPLNAVLVSAHIDDGDLHLSSTPTFLEAPVQADLVTMFDHAAKWAATTDSE